RSASAAAGSASAGIRARRCSMNASSASQSRGQRACAAASAAAAQVPAEVEVEVGLTVASVEVLCDSTTIVASCLSENDVLAVITGRLSDPELRAVEAHLDTCPPCRSLVACAGRDGSSSPDTPSQIGRYQILRTVGSGGMGTVYAA